MISRQRVYWQVRLWDEQENPGEWSEEVWFEMGLLRNEDWHARWIKGDYGVDKKYRYPTDHFKKEFVIKDVVKARMYITACGIYEAYINGLRVGEFVCAPGHTDYRKRIQYQTYDVTSLLQTGKNTITVELADGWYRGAQGAWGHTYIYGRESKFLLQLEIIDGAGKKKRLGTDDSWQWSNDGAIRFSDLKEGEYVDARCTPLYNGRAKIAAYAGKLTCSNNVPVTKHEVFRPSLIITPAGKKVLDFGQNLSGFIGFKVQAHEGQRIFLRMGEMLDQTGEFTQKNIQLSMDKTGEALEHVLWKNGLVQNLGQFDKGKTTPLQMLEYVAREGVNAYESHFALYGFRYALVETDIEFLPEDFYATAVYSDIKQTGFFESSNELLNQFVHCTLWSEKSNLADVPTDCPTRERSGWTGDAQIFFETASYLTEYHSFARKFLRDMTDRQAQNGMFHQIVPKGGEDFWMMTMNGSVGWADAGVLIPYRMWKKYGDERIISEHYDRMKRYAKFMMKRCGSITPLQKPLRLSRENQKYLVNDGQSYGEWAEPDDVCAFSVKDFIFPHPEESTAYTCYVMEHMAEIAEFLGYTEDAQEYQRYVQGCRLAYQELVTRQEFSLDTNRQAKLVRPLKMKLLDADCTKWAQKRLIQALEHYGWRLGTGFLSTPFILDVLSEIDVEYAYRLLENEECPGWLFMPKNGATTVWEAWEGNSTVSKGIASLNHYSKGAACEWLFKTMCGIQLSGENHFVIAPQPGGSFTYAKASYNSVYGEVQCSWKVQQDGVEYEVEIPGNCTAQVCLKDQVYDVSAGHYSWNL